MDILFRSALVIDGTGRDPFPGDVLVAGDRIVQVDRRAITPGRETRLIHANGLVLCPGFIDVHCHGEPLQEPEFHNYLAMGVTTILLGQDGESPTEGSLTEWFTAVDRIRPGVNIATLAGHGTLRHQAGIGLDRNPMPVALSRMQKRLDDALAAGAFGLSTGLEYLPGLYADTRELIALAEIVGRHQAIIMSHMRSEDDQEIMAAIDELLAQGRGGECAVHISHIKVTHGRGVARAEEILGRLDRARSDGLQVTADIYPYEASCTTIGILFPEFAKPPAVYRQVVASRREELAEYLRQRVARRNGPEATFFTTGRFAGRNLRQAAAEAGKPFEDLLIDDIGPDGAQGAYFVMDPELQARLLADPHIMISSDGSPTMGHPRGYGAFARVIRHFVQERRMLTLPQAIHKMTGLSARVTGLHRMGRGILKEGAFADLLLFDPSRVQDCATYEDPHRLATGFDLVLVNGQIARESGHFPRERAGRTIRSRLV